MAGKTKVKAKAKAKTKAAAGKVKVQRHDTVRKEILAVRDQIEHGFVDYARLLAEAHEKEFFRKWGFETFDEYCIDELDTHYRKAMYMVDIWRTVETLKLNAKEVADLGWTKMKDLATVINKKNAASWMKKAAKMSTRELTEAVKKVRRKDVKGKDLPVITTMTLRLGQSEAEIINEALGQAKKLCESENEVVALEMICQDWMMERGASPERTDLGAHVKYLEAIYGVKITHKQVKQKAKPKASPKAEAKKAAGKKKVKDKGQAEEATSIDDLTSEEGSDKDLDDLLGLSED